MIKLLTIIGARPQIIKAAALSRTIHAEFNNTVREVILHTGQHYDDSMSEVFFREMQIPSADYNLGIGSASHGSQTGHMIKGIEEVLTKEKPSIKHHENQSLSFDRQGVYHSGDVMYDNTLFFKELAIKKSPVLNKLGLEGQSYILATIHRPSNTDVPENLGGILKALNVISKEKHMPVILPLHPRTAAILKQDHARKHMELIRSNSLVRLIPAVSFLDMIGLEAGADLILTDSGGVQKEAWFMEKPVVVLREETEWVEIIEAGNGILTGPNSEKIIQAAQNYLEAPPGEYPPIFGDGKAARQILNVLSTANWQ